MTPQDFIKRWQHSTLKERSASQSHFNDLCALLEIDPPHVADPKGEWFCFERGAKKTGGGDGWADVWKRGHFGWEYKGPNKDLDKAYAQLQRYGVALENPPLLVVSDTRDIIIHSNFTNAVYETHTILLEDISDPENLQKLRWLFTDPERLRPGQTREAVTNKVAEAFAGIAQRLRDDGHEPQKVAHFVNRLLFCMFAEDVELLPDKLFTRMLEACERRPEEFAPMAKGLFAAMKGGGPCGTDQIAWFNGGLFDDDEALPMDADGVKQTLVAAKMDWSSIEPSIFGTMFERGLDPAKRSQLGAHYTDAASIMRIIEPVILKPLNAEWEACKLNISSILEKTVTAKSKAARTKAFKESQALLGIFLDRLRGIRILDPACGSGNFLYLALIHMKDLEHRVLLEAEAMGLGMQMPQIGPEVVRGIEINPYASELARVTVWIGQIQWMISHGLPADRKPILESLSTIENRDALINEDGSEAGWPEAEFIIGNPPFLGDKKMISELSEEYVFAIRRLYKGRVPGGADFVTFWFVKAHESIKGKKTERTGFVSTNSIRGGKNQEVLSAILKDTPIFEAWSDEPWIVDGAAVRVSLVSFGKGDSSPVLDGIPVNQINADLTGTILDLTKARKLKGNLNLTYQGVAKVGPFDIDGSLARQFLNMPKNPSGNHNSNVVRPWVNGLDITRRSRDMWIIDFGCELTEEDSALYEEPFEHALNHVKPVRHEKDELGEWKVRRKAHRERWWRYGEARPGMREKIKPLSRYIITPRVSKYRLFRWMEKTVTPDCATFAIARDDDGTFGILHSRFHELWSLAMCTFLGVGNDPRYTPTTCFETFPFPEVSDESAQFIAESAKRLDELRNNWLNPMEWVERVPEVVADFPDRIIAKEGHEADLKKRTLTNLYNARPSWLNNIHKELDIAVASAYGWDDYTAEMADEEILARLFKLNQERANGD